MIVISTQKDRVNGFGTGGIAGSRMRHLVMVWQLANHGNKKEVISVFISGGSLPLQPNIYVDFLKYKRFLRNFIIVVQHP
ncbi:MAG: hypothetical protein ONB16_02295 [candidate division KSB1 bacterium]|nr:hypothetical protein [candidate division KSB1 bacterium]